jgi:hypothetical protein
MSDDRKRFPEYHVWASMLHRCIDEKTHNKEHYLDRGIVVCERWQQFENFYADMGPRPSAKHSIERKDVNGNYEPNNCEWATIAEQNRNRTDTRRIELNGKTVCGAELARLCGVHRKTIYRWLDNGFSGYSILQHFTAS